MSQEKNLRVYTFLRLMMLFSVLVSLIMYQRTGLLSDEVISRTYLITFFTFLVTTAFIFLYEKTKLVSYFLTSQIGYDILFTTALIFYTGPFDSVYSVFFFFNIIFAAIFFRTRGALLAGLVSALMYLLVAWFGPDSVGREKSFSLLTTLTAFIAISLLSGQLVEEQRKSRQKISRLEELNEEIVESLDSGLLGLDQERMIRKINRTALRMLGFQVAQEVIARPLGEVFPALGDGRESEVKEVRIRGKSRRLLINRVELPENHVMVLLRDLTDVLDLEEKLRRQEKLAGFDRLAAGVAHEIRNPIASISGAAQLLGSANEREEREHLLSLIVRETERVDRLVAQLLKFSRPPKTARGEIDLSILINECVESLRARQDFQVVNAELVVQIESRLKVNGNRDELAEVVTNLLTNAFQALLSVTNEKKAILVSAKRVDDAVEVIVSDSGPGIPKEYRSRVFDPFFTTKATGTGLGLAQVHRIIQNHDGQVDIESEVGKGTSLKIRLPA